MDGPRDGMEGGWMTIMIMTIMMTLILKLLDPRLRTVQISPMGMKNGNWWNTAISDQRHRGLPQSTKRTPALIRNFFTSDLKF